VTGTADGAWNAAYDLWFKTDPAPGPPDGAELMIWLDSRGGVRRGAVQSSWHLVTVEAGFEIWRAGTGLAADSFTFTGG
jgi:hypothetical protein